MLLWLKQKRHFLKGIEMKTLLLFAFVVAWVLCGQLANSSNPSIISNTERGYILSVGSTAGPGGSTFMTDYDIQEIEFLMWLGVYLSPDREGYNCQIHDDRVWFNQSRSL